MASTFILCRRWDATPYADGLFDALEQRLGAGVVARAGDVRSSTGEGISLADQLQSSRVLLPIVGPEWRAEQDEGGGAVKDSEVRAAIAAALDDPDVLVIPILLDGAEMPAEDLHPEIAGVTGRPAVPLRRSTWNADIDRLAGLIRRPRIHADALPPAAPRRPRLISRLAPWAGAGAVSLVVTLIASALAEYGRLSPDVPTGGVEETAAADASPAPGLHGLEIPRLSEIAHGNLVYSLLSASLAPGGAARDLRLRVRVTNDGATDARVGNGEFLLSAGNMTIAPAPAAGATVAPGATADVILTFAVPDVPQASLRVTRDGAAAEVPLTLALTGRAADDERVPAGDPLARAFVRAIIREPRILFMDDPLSVTLTRVNTRRFVNTLRIIAGIRITNIGAAPLRPDGLTMHVVTPEVVVSPPALSGGPIAPGGERLATFTFDIPPASSSAILRASSPRTTINVPLELR